MPRIYLIALMAAAALAWLTLLWLNGVSVPAATFFKPFSWVESLLLTLVIVFDRWAWRWRVLRPWLVSTPNLNGTWKGELVSTYEESRGPIEAYLVIRQTFSSLRIRLMTRESNSYLLAGAATPDQSGLHIVTGIYRNVPDLLRRSVSPIHHGAILLQVRKNPPNLLQGEYWTDRDTKGELRFTARSSRVFDSFEAAAEGPYG